MLDYNREHWERLMATILERIGATEFLDHAAYALEQSGYQGLASRMADLMALQVLTPDVPESSTDDLIKLVGDIQRRAAHD